MHAIKKIGLAIITITLTITQAHATRWYSANTGRWFSRDSIAENGGLNLYAFIANEPISRFDVLGRAGFGNLRKAESCGCKCKQVQIKYGNGSDQWQWGITVFPKPDGELHTGKAGDNITVKWLVEGDPKQCTFTQTERGQWHFVGPPGSSSPKDGPKNGDYTIPAANTAIMEPTYSYGNSPSLTYTDYPGVYFYPADAGAWTATGTFTMTLKCEGSDNKIDKIIAIDAPSKLEIPQTTLGK